MFKCKFYIILLALTGALTVAAQHDSKAKEILDKVAASYNQCDGLRIDFKGTQKGTLWIKGNCFVLDSGGVKSWFDGSTQWSYVASNEEVTISSPTPEEVQTVNPYALITMYRNGFNYRYEGLKMRNGHRVHEINLIPQKQEEIRMFIFSVNEQFEPTYIGIDMKNGHYEEFIITHFDKLSLSTNFFQFDEKQYTDAEVIDLR